MTPSITLPEGLTFQSHAVETRPLRLHAKGETVQIPCNIITCAMQSERMTCPNCARPMKRHGCITKTAHHIPHEGMPTLLEISVQMFLCMRCKPLKPIHEPLPDTVTDDLRDWIMSRPWHVKAVDIRRDTMLSTYNITKLRDRSKQAGTG